MTEADARAPGGPPAPGLPDQLLQGLASGRLRIVDLTAPLHEQTPMIRLPAERGQPWPFSREPISRYDAKGPQVYWNNLRLCEHTGTHFDAPIHWLSGRAFDDVSQVPVRRLVAPAVVIDLEREAGEDPAFLLERRHVEDWIARHGALPEGGWLLLRSGWSRHGQDPEAFLNGGVTPGVHPLCAQWLAEQTAIQGLGVETVGTDAGQAGGFEPAYPCHWFFHGANKYGLTQLRHLAELPARGALLIVAPLPIVGGSGSPCRVIAIFEKEAP
ncbi:cyclase family protein [Pelomonas sp. CA6]|uniref:cyclase family protein n=1 Tax=Pelomonas sp. CA6 TaxID=2907999 RepID=UPI001F4BE347|nr:cyclase family protein [Pelomonas sp. CA6]MCH7343143.1 cyclase family protein [Pelomonas sp. CA6]